MNKVKIITDSCADLSGELLKKYDIDYAKMSTVEDGKESPALLTWSSEDAHRLYETIRGGKRITTAQVSVEEFTSVFTKYLDAGYDIVYIGCSSKQSGSVNTANVIANKLCEKYTNSKIFCIDSLNASYGEGILAIEASKEAQNGKSAQEINSHILKIRKTVQEFATVHTLDHLKKAGRVSATSAFFGNLMGVKPILTADAKGNQSAYKKVKGRQTSIAEIVALLKENIVNPEEQTIYIGHADCPLAEVEQVEKLVRQEIPCKDVNIGYIGPIIGASVGPDAIGVWAFGKEVTFVSEAN
ncbi:MAG: DegV family protein [Acutalibacteraceae bacterium]|nr:DegV family protein [Acutalibacteraceae bacterium]